MNGRRILTVTCDAIDGIGGGCDYAGGGVVAEGGTSGAFTGYIAIAARWEGGGGNEDWKEEEQGCGREGKHFGSDRRMKERQLEACRWGCMPKQKDSKKVLAVEISMGKLKIVRLRLLDWYEDNRCLFDAAADLPLYTQ